MNHKPIISVIVPVYNVADYVGKCIESILAQTFRDFELLLIDDGSTDDSGEICERYARSDSRITVYHQENAGVSAVRELGRNLAKGEYSIYADADDWVEPDMLCDLYVRALETKADMVICDFYMDDSDYMRQLLSGTDGHSVICDILSGRTIGSTWNKLVRHSLYDELDVHFPVGVNYCEDALVMIHLLKHIDRVEYVPEAYYHYVMRQDSITHQQSKSLFEQRETFIKTVQRLLPDSCFKSAIAMNMVYIRRDAYCSRLFAGRELRRMLPRYRWAIFRFPLIKKFRIRLLLFLASLGLTSLSRLLERDRDGFPQ